MESVLADEKQDRFSSQTAFLRHPRREEQVCRPFNNLLMTAHWQHCNLPPSWYSNLLKSCSYTAAHLKGAQHDRRE